MILAAGAMGETVSPASPAPHTDQLLKGDFNPKSLVINTIGGALTAGLFAASHVD